MKKELPGVPFKLFSDSLNMKRLSSDLVLFMLVKVFEEKRLLSDSLSLFQSHQTNLQKRN
jgi:hypothetical protein